MPSGSGSSSSAGASLPDYGAGLPEYGTGLPEYGSTGSSQSSGTQTGSAGSSGGFPEYGEYGQNGAGGASGTDTGSTQGSGQTAGSPGGTGSQDGSGDIAYGTADDPFGDLRTDNGSGNGDGSVQARIDVLDARLEEGYAVFDGMILGERDRAQGSGGNGNESAGDGPGGIGGSGSGSGDVGEPVILATNSGVSSNAGGGYIPEGTASRQGTFGAGERTTYEVPPDIPQGNDDDVVARQLREAAMTEPDPELREKLWDEYRAYTGLAVE